MADDRHQHTELEPLARRIYEVERNKYGDDGPQTLADLLTIAHMISRSGRPEESVRAGELGLARYERVYGADDVRTALAVRSLGDFLAEAARPVDAERAYDRAAAMCRHAPGDVTSAFSGGKNCDAYFNASISNGYRQLGLYEKAEPLLIGFRTRPYAFASTQSSIGDLDDLGDFHFEYGNYPKALWYYRACKALWDSVHRDAPATLAPLYQARDIAVAPGNGAHAFHSVAPSCLEDLIEATDRAGDGEQAMALREQETRAWARADIEAAERDLRRKIKLVRENDSFAPISLAYEYEALGFLYNKKQRCAEANEAFERAHELQQKNWELLSEAERHVAARDRLDSLLMRGDNAAACGDVAKAEDSYRKFADVAQRYLNNRHRWRLEGLARLALLYGKSRRYDDALAMWERYLAQARRSRGGEDLETAWGLMQQAAVYQAMGRTADAQQARRRAQQIRARRLPEIAAVRALPLPAALQSDETLVKEFGN